MVPTFFTNLALGTITTMVASIMALSSWVAGSQILQGNLFFDTTNNATPGIYVGTQQALGVTAGGLNSITNGTQSGVVLKDNGTTAIASYTVACSGTGGLAGQYDTCRIPALLASTGAITRVTLMVSASPAVVGIDCGFTKAVRTATGTVFGSLNNIQTATGSIYTFATGSGGSVLRWNSVDAIKCGTRGTPTTSFAGKLRVDYFDDTSE